MELVSDVHRVTATSAMLISAVAWGLFTSGIFVHRWLSKVSGHGIPPVVPARHLP